MIDVKLLKVGARVIGKNFPKNSGHEEFNNCIGTIIYVRDISEVGVDFDKGNYGHNCMGNAKPGCGWYFYQAPYDYACIERNLEIIDLFYMVKKFEEKGLL